MYSSSLKALWEKKEKKRIKQQQRLVWSKGSDEEIIYDQYN